MFLRKNFIQTALLLTTWLTAPCLQAIPTEDISFSETEQAWIQAHPTLNVASEMDWPPFDYTENGESKGYSIDIIHLIEKKTGQKVNFVNGYTWAELLNKFKAGEIDIMPVIYRNKEREAYTLFTKPYFSLPSVIVTHANDTSITDSKSLANKRIAGAADFAITKALKDQFPEATFVTVKNVTDGVKAVSTGKADAFIGSLGVISHTLKSNYIPNVKIISDVNIEGISNPKLRMGIGKNNPALRDIIDKVIQSITPEEKSALHIRWLSTQPAPVTSNHKHSLTLSAQEQAWLDAHPVIRLAADISWPPFEWIDEEKQYQGISSDYIKLIEEQLGIRFEVEKEKSWPEVVQAVKEHELDVFSCVAKNPQRLEYVNFTRPYLSFPMVIITSDKVEYIDGVKDLEDKRVGVVSGYATHDYLKSSNPEIKLHLFKTSREGMVELSQGKIDAFVDNIATASTIIQQNGLTNLKISGDMPIRYELAMAVRKDWPEFVDILQHALDAISEEKRKQIHNKWIGVRYEHSLDYSLLWKALAAFITIVGVMYFYVRRLSLEVKQRKLSESRFHTLFEMSDDANMTLDRDGFIDCNQATLEMFGFKTKQEFLGKHPSELSPPFQPDGTASDIAANERIASAYDKGKNFFEWTHRRINGDEFPAEVLLTPMELEGKNILHAIVRDITDRKQSEQALERFKTTLDETMDCVFLFEPASLKFFYVNSGATEQLGYSFDELMNMRPIDIKPEFNEKQFRNLIEPLMTGKEKSISLETTHQHRDGHLIPVGILIQYIDPPGEPARFVAIVRDISAQIKASQALITARNEAENANRAKSDFLSSMSHELRTPMNAILGFSQLLQIEDLTEEQQDNVNEIHRAGEHLLKLINEVLDLAKIEAGQIDLSIQPIILSESIDECLSLIDPLAKKKMIKIDVDSSVNDHVVIKADMTRLHQVLLNLLSNAIKYNNPDGNVRISCETQPDNMVAIKIIDNGPGISKEKQKDLFSAFSRLGAEQSEIEGTGIGLMLTRNIVELMGGNIGMESEEGNGCTFWVSLPCNDIDIVRKKISTKNNSEQITYEHKDNFKILYIEDNPSNLTLVNRLLGSRPNIILHTAHTPQLGLDLIMAQAYDLFLLDINLPGMSGYEVVKIIRANDDTKNIPAIAISANAMKQDIEKGLSAGFDEYLTKPINISEFNQTIDNALANWSKNNS